MSKLLKDRFSRRALLRMGAFGAGAALLSACQPKVVEKEVTKVVKEVVKETVVVEGTPQVVEKEVERVVTAQPTAKGKPHVIYYDRTSSATAWGEAFNKVQDEIELEVQIQPPESRYEQLIAAITAGNAPDVIGLDCVQVGRFAEIGALAPLQDILPQDIQDKYFQNLVTTSRHYGVYEGDLLGVPFWVDMSCMYYNREMLEAVGGDPDVGIESWDQYVEYGQAIMEEMPDVFGFSMLTGGGSDFLYQPWIWAQGGDFVNADWTASTADSEEVYEMLKFTHDLVNVHEVTNDAAATDWGTAQNLFTGGNAMACHNGGGLVGLIRSEFPELWEALGVCLIPGPEAGQASSFIGGNVASIATQTQEREAVIRVLEWLTASEEGQEVTGDIGYLCGTPEGMELPVFKEDWHIYEPFKLGLDIGYPASNDPRFEEVRSPYMDAVTDAQLGEKSIEEVQNTLHEEINRILQR